MISYGARLSDFKRSVIQYITDKTKEYSYRNDPTLLKIYPSGTVSAVCGTGETKLELCSIERLCNIADKLHFSPLRDLLKQESSGKGILEQTKNHTITTSQGTDMAFEIKNNIPLPGQIFIESSKVEKKSTGKTLNYRTLPLKDMKVGECIILHECDADTVYSKYASSKMGIARFVQLMDTKKKFKVARTDDHKVGVWRIE